MDDCGFIPLMLLSWASPIMKKGFKKPLELSDLGKLPRGDSAAVNYRRLERFWTEEVNSKGIENASIGKTLFRTVRTRVILSSLMFLLSLFASFVGPVSLAIFDYLTFDVKVRKCSRLTAMRVRKIIDKTIFYNDSSHSV